MDQQRENDKSAWILEKLAESSPDAFWMVTPDLEETIFVDQAYVDLWNAPLEEFQEDPRSFFESVHPDDRQRVRKCAERAMEAESVTIECQTNPDTDPDPPTYVRIRGEPVYDEGEFVAIAGFSVDITDHRLTEIELEQQNERLEVLNSLLSHDLLNQLQTATLRLDGVRAEYDDNALDYVSESLTRMEELVQSISTLVRETDTVKGEETVWLADIAGRSWTTTATQSASIHIEDTASIQADRQQLQSLFENLFRNSVEHNKDTVTIHVGVLPTGDGFYIEDDGAGIPEEERDKVFELKYSGEKTGSGLGLTIVEEVADAHSWDTSITESEYGGARFEFTNVDIKAM